MTHNDFMCTQNPIGSQLSKLIYTWHTTNVVINVLPFQQQ